MVLAIVIRQRFLRDVRLELVFVIRKGRKDNRGRGACGEGMSDDERDRLMEIYSQSAQNDQMHEKRIHKKTHTHTKQNDATTKVEDGGQAVNALLRQITARSKAMP